MIVVVSNKALELYGDSDILVVESLLDASRLVGGVDALVYHSSNETTNDFAANLATLKSKSLGSLWYVSSKDNKDDLIEMSIIGNGGFYVDDEFFLESPELIKSLVSGGASNQLVSLGGLGVLKDFTNRYLSDTSTEIPKGYLQVLKSAVSQLSEDYKNKSNQLLVVSEKATNVIENTSLGLKEQERERQNLAQIIADLESSVSDSSVPSKGSNVTFFPRISYRKEKDIIRVKDIGRTPYLFSFIYGFMKYCDKVLNKRPKLIVVETVGSIYEEHYKDFNWITSSNYGDASKYVGDMVITNYPTTGVITKLLEDTTKDTFIVLDRTTTSREHVLNSRSTRSVHYAVSGVSMVDSLKLKNLGSRIKYFTSISSREGAEFTIPTLDYPSNSFERENLYLSRCSSMYRELFKRG